MVGVVGVVWAEPPLTIVFGPIPQVNVAVEDDEAECPSDPLFVSYAFARLSSKEVVRVLDLDLNPEFLCWPAGEQIDILLGRTVVARASRAWNNQM